jgi:hypothetical protein
MAGQIGAAALLTLLRLNVCCYSHFCTCGSAQCGFDLFLAILAGGEFRFCWPCVAEDSRWCAQFGTVERCVVCALAHISAVCVRPTNSTQAGCFAGHLHVLLTGLIFCSLSFYDHMTRYGVLSDDSSDRLHACPRAVLQHANACSDCIVSGGWQILHAHDVVCDCCWPVTLFVGRL